MSKRSLITNITPLPSSISRDTAVAQLHDHRAMIELNPLVLRHEPTDPPPNATPDEAQLGTWYLITDEIHYLPGGVVKGEVSYKACFYDLPLGIQTHVFAPAGVDIKSKWSVGGNVPGKEPREASELGVNKPKDGLYIKEELHLRCNLFMSTFVKKNLKKSHLVIVDKIIERAKDKSIQAPGKANLCTRAPALLSGRTSLRTDLTKTSPHRELQYSCACEGTVHASSCAFFHPDDLQHQDSLPPFRASQPKPYYAISLPASASSYSGSPDSPRLERSLSELYGSTSPGECLCTGALHEQSCSSFPALRAPRLPSSHSMNSPTSSVQLSPLATHGTGYGMTSIDSQAHASAHSSHLPQNLSHLVSAEQAEVSAARSSLDEWLQQKMMPEALNSQRYSRQISGSAAPRRLREQSSSPDPR
ncbi:hypothetical protein AC579_6032 [Pseudocercospora musae]|uniref:DUF7053 domain-containing protein n=1 Tax=Pseudocercospora musae TaxID=113226 RepID=A0A139IFH7_9PEZI|nr:hypothetical protein AC579_6032 [Pseudocercospora musae]